MLDNTVLDDFIGDFRLNRKYGISIVSRDNILELKTAGYTVEDMLDYLGKTNNSLYHGSRDIISDSNLKPGERGEVCCSDLSAIAIMKAIISNIFETAPFNLGYWYHIDEQHPMGLEITGIHDDTIGENGYVYVINQRHSFKNNPKGSWQYVARDQTVPINARISVERIDYTYPIYDITNKRRIQ